MSGPLCTMWHPWAAQPFVSLAQGRPWAAPPCVSLTQGWHMVQRGPDKNYDFAFFTHFQLKLWNNNVTNVFPGLKNPYLHTTNFSLTLPLRNSEIFLTILFSLFLVIYHYFPPWFTHFLQQTKCHIIYQHLSTMIWTNFHSSNILIYLQDFVSQNQWEEIVRTH